MKILHITAMAPLSPNSGIPAVLKELTDAQNKISDVESIVLSLKGDVKSIGSPSFFYLGEEPILSFLDNYKPDVAIIHSFFHPEYIAASKALINRKVPFYIEPHGSFGHQAMKKSKIKKIIANSTVFRDQIRKSKGYIFTNKAELEDSVYRTPNDLVIPNGVLPTVINCSRMKTEKSYYDPVFYYLGRFDIHHKGLDYLLDALEIIDKEGYQFTVNLYGTGTDEQISYVNDKIKQFKNLNISNCGTIYGDDKKNALEASNILLLTSRYEGSPMTVLDGLSYGNPCLVTPGTNVSEEVVDNSIGWSTELDSRIIAKSILEARKMYIEDGKGYFKRSKEYVLENYSWDRIANYSIKQLLV